MKGINVILFKFNVKHQGIQGYPGGMLYVRKSFKVAMCSIIGLSSNYGLTAGVASFSLTFLLVEDFAEVGLTFEAERDVIVN